MKVILLLAGKGRRMGSLTENRSKTLIHLLGKPILGHLMERFIFNDLNDIVTIVGYRGEMITSFLNEQYGKDIRLTTLVNTEYEMTNNLYSLWLARDILSDSDFIVCNGDVVLNREIIRDLMNAKARTAIAIDDTPRQTQKDSPGTIVRDGRIFDLGRHIPYSDNGGYAIGLYKFGSNISKAFFDEAGKMIEEGNFNAGFHDPLIKLFNSYIVAVSSTRGLLWTDVDTKEDIQRAEEILARIRDEEGRLLS